MSCYTDSEISNVQKHYDTHIHCFIISFPGQVGTRTECLALI